MRCFGVCGFIYQRVVAQRGIELFPSSLELMVLHLLGALVELAPGGGPAMECLDLMRIILLQHASSGDGVASTCQARVQGIIESDARLTQRMLHVLLGPHQQRDEGKQGQQDLHVSTSRYRS